MPNAGEGQSPGVVLGTDVRKRRREGGMIPVMKSIAAMKEQIADLAERVGGVEKELTGTSSAVDGMMKGALVECPECESFIQVPNFPKHWLKMHQPKVEEEIRGEIEESPLNGDPWIIREIEESPLIGEPMPPDGLRKVILEIWPERPSGEIIDALEKFVSALRKKGWLGT